MTGVEFIYLRRSVRSLTSSTDIAAEGGGVRVAVFGRNRLLSHQEYYFEQSESGSKIVLVANRRYALAISGAIDPGTLPDPAAAIRLAGAEPGTPGVFGPVDGRLYQWHVLRAPRGIIASLAEQMVQLGIASAAFALPVVTVAVAIPQLQGWDEEGRPVYRVRSPQPEGGDGQCAGLSST